MLAVALKPGIEDSLYRRLLLEPSGQRQGIRAVCFHTQAQRLEAFQKYPGIERAHGRPCRSEESKYALTDNVFGAHYRTAHTPALAIQELGR